MTKQEFYKLLDDINNTDTDFDRRLDFARLVVEYTRYIGGIVDIDER